MASRGKCPKCDTVIDHFDLENVAVGKSFHAGVSLVCPHCQTILSAAIDPVALKQDIVAEILDALGAAPGPRSKKR